VGLVEAGGGRAVFFRADVRREAHVKKSRRDGEQRERQDRAGSHHG
jgi:hypothetical protein